MFFRGVQFGFRPLQSYANPFLFRRNFSTENKLKNIAEKLSSSSTFEEFKSKMDDSFQEFCQEKTIKLICEDDPERLKDAYESYCRLKFNRFKTEGNPALMIGHFEEKTLAQKEF